MPQALEMLNQAVSIRKEPETEHFMSRKIVQFQVPSHEHIQSLYHAFNMRDSVKDKFDKEAERL